MGCRSLPRSTAPRPRAPADATSRTAGDRPDRSSGIPRAERSCQRHFGGHPGVQGSHRTTRGSGRFALAPAGHQGEPPPFARRQVEVVVTALEVFDIHLHGLGKPAGADRQLVAAIAGWPGHRGKPHINVPYRRLAARTNQALQPPTSTPSRRGGTRWNVTMTSVAEPGTGP